MIAISLAGSSLDRPAKSVAKAKMIPNDYSVLCGAGNLFKQISVLFTSGKRFPQFPFGPGDVPDESIWNRLNVMVEGLKGTAVAGHHYRYLEHWVYFLCRYHRVVQLG